MDYSQRPHIADVVNDITEFVTVAQSQFHRVRELEVLLENERAYSRTRITELETQLAELQERYDAMAALWCKPSLDERVEDKL